MEEVQKLIEQLLNAGYSHEEVVVHVAQQMGVVLPEEGEEPSEEAEEAIELIDGLVSEVEGIHSPVEEEEEEE